MSLYSKLIFVYEYTELIFLRTGYLIPGSDGLGSAEEVVVYGSRAVYGLALLPLAVAASAVRGHYGARRA